MNKMRHLHSVVGLKENWNLCEVHTISSLLRASKDKIATVLIPNSAISVLGNRVVETVVSLLFSMSWTQHSTSAAFFLESFTNSSWGQSLSVLGGSSGSCGPGTVSSEAAGYSMNHQLGYLPLGPNFHLRILTEEGDDGKIFQCVGVIIMSNF